MNDLSFAEVERVEATTLSELSASAAPGLIRAERVGGGLVLTRPGHDALFWNRATAFDRVATRNDVEAVLACLRAQGVKRALLRAAPGVLDALTKPDPAAGDPAAGNSATGDSAARDGASLTPEAAQSKWAAPVDVAEDRTRDTRTELRIERVQAPDARHWSGVMCAIGGMDDAVADAFAAMVHRPGWHGFAAWDGDAIVGTGMLFVQGRIGHLIAGTVAETHRRRGAQSALIAARVRAARQAGAQWLTSDTADEPGGPATSGRNLGRAGFTLLYARPAWLWTDSSSATAGPGIGRAK